jgi:asparaginyl-tRNA synthetase
MKREDISKVLAQGKVGESVTIAGWIKTLRVTKAMAFLHLNDGSCFDSIQVTLDSSLPNYDEVTSQITGASVVVTGEVRESPASGQRIELAPSKIEVTGTCDASSPIQKARAGFEFLRTVGHMRPRTNTFGAVFRLRSELAFAVNKFFHERGFFYAHTPILTTSDCEGAGEMFQVTTLDLEKPLPRTETGSLDYSQDFFGQRCGLTVSGQLEAEVLACSLGKVYTFGPTFRAENSNTTRHAAEFWMIEPEMAFADLRDDIALAEDFVKALIKHAFERCEGDLKFFDERIEKGLIKKLAAILESEFAVIEYRKAVEVLQASGRKFDFEVAFGKDLKGSPSKILYPIG